MTVQYEAQLLHARTLIELLHPAPHAQALIEITGLQKKVIPAKRYFFDATLAATFGLELNARGYSSFVNVNPRNAMAAFEHNVSVVTALALDLQPERTSIAGVVKALDDAGIPPSITCVSGNGVHMYLRVEPADAVKAKIVGERLIKYVGSDPIQNASRIMRLPGTVNWKPPVAKWCYIVNVDLGRRYNVSFVDQRLSAVGAPPARLPKEGIPISVDPPEDWLEVRKRLSPGVLDIIDTGERNAYSEKQVTRSEADFVVVCALVRAGCTDEMVEWVYESTNVGIMKYRTTGAGYLHRTIEAARRATVEARPPAAPVSQQRYAPYAPRGGARDRVFAGSSRR